MGLAPQPVNSRRAREASPFYRFLTQALTLGVKGAPKNKVPQFVGLLAYLALVGLLVAANTIGSAAARSGSVVLLLVAAVMLLLLVFGGPLIAWVFNLLASVVVVAFAALVVIVVLRLTDDDDLTIRGNVLTSDDSPVANAQVSIEGDALVTSTNEQGFFQLTVSRRRVTRDDSLTIHVRTPARTSRFERAIGNRPVRLVMESAAGTSQTIGPASSEPSGLALTNLLDRDGRQLLLVVDDEVRDRAFLIREPDTSRTEEISKLLVGAVGLPSRPKDLEGVTFDGKDAYYAITSHRVREGKERATRQLLTFTIDANWRAPGYQAPAQPPSGTDLSPALYDFLREKSVSIDSAAWAGKGTDSLHPYALEIEGLAVGENILFVGLKWPLPQGRALLLRYDLITHKFVGLDRLDLGGYGIGALTVVPSGHLLVAANPSERAGESEKVCGASYGRSRLYAFVLPQTGAPFAPAKAHIDAGDRCGRLEGVAQVGGSIVMVYDGARPVVRRMSADWLPLPSVAN